MASGAPDYEENVAQVSVGTVKHQAGDAVDDYQGSLADGNTQTLTQSNVSTVSNQHIANEKSSGGTLLVKADVDGDNTKEQIYDLEPGQSRDFDVSLEIEIEASGGSVDYDCTVEGQA